jgi:hypothetical protein
MEQQRVPAAPIVEFDASADQTIHRTAEAAIADEANDDEKVCCICGEPMPEDRVALQKTDTYTYPERVNYAHMSCIQERLQHNGEN